MAGSADNGQSSAEECSARGGLAMVLDGSLVVVGEFGVVLGQLGVECSHFLAQILLPELAEVVVEELLVFLELLLVVSDQSSVVGSELEHVGVGLSGVLVHEPGVSLGGVVVLL